MTLTSSGHEPPDRRHIHIETGPLRLDYQACAQQAETVALQLAQHFPHIRVAVDDKVHEHYPRLPCARLWD